MSNNPIGFNETAISNFQNYLRIKSVQPNPDYEGIKTFLSIQAKELNLDFKTTELVTGKPIILLTWFGNDNGKGSDYSTAIMLNSHTDVVPVFPDYWKYDPFSAHLDESGDIYARGSQDMKCVGSQYLEAIRKLKTNGFTPRRNIILSFVPDEEIGGHDGMEKFVETDEFRKLNIGIAMDEGLASPTEEYSVYYGERLVWWLRVHCKGQAGHGSQFLANNAGVKIRNIIDRFMDFRAKEEKRMLESNGQLGIGEVTTVNMTGLSGGVQHNVVPDEFVVGFDIRITPHTNLEEFENMLLAWCKESGLDITLEYLQKDNHPHLTSISKTENPWWVAFSEVCDSMGMKIRPQIFPAATDSRYIRKMNIPAIGFSPMNMTPILLHDHNERLNQNVFLDGIDFYTRLIPALDAVED